MATHAGCALPLVSCPSCPLQWLQYAQPLFVSTWAADCAPLCMGAPVCMVRGDVGRPVDIHDCQSLAGRNMHDLDSEVIGALFEPLGDCCTE
jgi:hypothetical protein